MTFKINNNINMKNKIAEANTLTANTLTANTLTANTLATKSAK